MFHPRLEFFWSKFKALLMTWVVHIERVVWRHVRRFQMSLTAFGLTPHAYPQGKGRSYMRSTNENNEYDVNHKEILDWW